MPPKGQFTHYKCGICEDCELFTQKSHLTAQKRTNKHQQQKKIKELELAAMNKTELKEKYGTTSDKKA